MEREREGSQVESQREASEEATPTHTLIVDFQPLELRRMTCLSHPVCISLWQSEQVSTWGMELGLCKLQRGFRMGW